jgi:hypothetical protein
VVAMAKDMLQNAAIETYEYVVAAADEAQKATQKADAAVKVADEAVNKATRAAEKADNAANKAVEAVNKADKAVKVVDEAVKVAKEENERVAKEEEQKKKKKKKKKKKEKAEKADEAMAAPSLTSSLAKEEVKEGAGSGANKGAQEEGRVNKVVAEHNDVEALRKKEATARLQRDAAAHLQEEARFNAVEVRRKEEAEAEQKKKKEEEAIEVADKALEAAKATAAKDALPAKQNNKDYLSITPEDGDRIARGKLAKAAAAFQLQEEGRANAARNLKAWQASLTGGAAQPPQKGGSKIINQNIRVKELTKLKKLYNKLNKK